MEKEKTEKMKLKKLEKMKAESEKPAGENDDFKNSLAALLSRGKPGMA